MEERKNIEYDETNNKKTSALTKILFVILFLVTVFPNSLFELFGQTRCLTVAKFVGENILTPIVGVGMIFLILYFLYYYFWYIPRKIIKYFRFF